jgi:ParB/RepB/Spo0J family partition protein
MNIQEIRISDISPDPDQPRKTFDAEALERLSQSIRDNGIEQPIIVRKNGAGYIIIDGERRWRAAKAAGLKETPSIISTDDSILEKQLRSDCLKEGLTVDELDRAIYRYYEHYGKESRKSELVSPGGCYGSIAVKIGKSDVRVRKAIDRFEFKNNNPEISNLQKDPAEDGHDVLNATIAMTSQIKDNDTRVFVIQEAVEHKASGTLQNEDVNEIVRQIVEDEITDKDEVQNLFDFKAEERQIKKDNKKPRRKKEKKEKKNKPDREHRDAVRAITKTTKSLSIVNNGIEELFKLWSIIDRELQEAYLHEAKRFITIHKRSLKKDYKMIGE